MKRLLLTLFSASCCFAQGNICAIGDSITNSYASNPTIGMTDLVANALTTYSGKAWTVNTHGSNGTSSWDWVGGGSYLPGAITSCQGTGATYATVMLGTNDARAAVATSQSDYQTNMASMIAALKTAGINKIMLNYSPYVDYTNGGISGWNAASNTLLMQYQVAIQTLSANDPTHVFVGDTFAYSTFSANHALLSDGVHPTGTSSPVSNLGYVTLSNLWTQAFKRLFLSSVIYLRSSGPPPVAVIGATNATPVVLTTFSAHGFGTDTLCDVSGVTTGLDGISPANGVMTCRPVDTTHLALYDKTNTTPIAPTANGHGGDWWPGYNRAKSSQNASWVAKVVAYTIPDATRGYFDGDNGHTLRRWALRNKNGMTSLVVALTSGGNCTSGTCTVTVTTSYDPTVEPSPPAVGDYFGINGTGTALDTCVGSSSPLQIASVSSSGWVSSAFACSGLSAGATNIATANRNCGPKSVPDDTRGSTEYCATVSLEGQTQNAYWVRLKSLMSSAHLNASPDYKVVVDGGMNYAVPTIHGSYSLASLSFLVDPTSDLNLAECAYSLNHPEYTSGPTFAWNQGTLSPQSNQDFNYNDDAIGIAINAAVCKNYLSPSHKQTLFDKIFNDIDDANVTGITTVNSDLSETNHNWLLASGNIAAGTNDGTHVTLASSGDCKVGSELHLGSRSDWNGGLYGLVTGCAGPVATVASGWKTASNGGTSEVPELTHVISGTYISGTTCTGASGSYVALDTGGLVAYAFLSGVNTLSTGSPLTLLYGGTFAAAPTKANVTGYAGQASCSGTATISTTLGMTYDVYDTITYSSTTPGARGVTVTFTYSDPRGILSIGDGIVPKNGWMGNTSVHSDLGFVTAVSATTATLTLNSMDGGWSSLGSGGGKVMAWRIPKWAPGDPGWTWPTKHAYNNGLGNSGAVYPYAVIAGYNNNTGLVTGGANGAGGDPSAYLGMYLSMMDEGSRAQREIARAWTALWDYTLNPYLDLSTGFTTDGSQYGYAANQSALGLLTWVINNTAQGASPAFPTINGSWNLQFAIQNMFSTLPDLRGGDLWNFGWDGYQAGVNAGTPQSLAFSFSPSFLYDSTSMRTKQMRNWMENARSYGSRPQSYWGLEASNMFGAVSLHQPSNIKSVNYRTQAPQYLFNVSSPALCSSLLGLTCGVMRLDRIVSRSPGWASKNDTLYYFNSGTFWGAGGTYQSPPTSSFLFKGTYLLATDSSVPRSGGWNTDVSRTGDAMQFGGDQADTFNEFKNGVGSGNLLTQMGAPITIWRGATQDGDITNLIVYACSDSKNAYNQSALSITIGYNWNCILHAKTPGYDEWIANANDAYLSAGSTPIARHIHFSQNGQAKNSPTTDAGRTTCPGGGCTGANPTGVLVSLPCTSPGAGNCPDNATFGLQTAFYSPGAINLTDDCVGKGGGQCAPGDTYPGGLGYTHRYTVSAGALGSSQSRFTLTTLHKIMQTPSNTTFTSSATLTPDANWTGGHACGSTSCMTYLWARNNIRQPSIASFTVAADVSKSQYLIAGLLPGMYTPTVNGVAVTTCNGTATPCAVAAGDTTLYFDDAHTGSVIVSVTAGSGPVTGTAGTQFFGDVRVTNGTIR